MLSGLVTNFDTPTDIDIYTAKLDFEDNLWGGKLGAGTKFSRVASDNTFLVFDEINGSMVRNDRRSNQFNYDENVYAGYLSYNRQLNQKWSMNAGLRAEQTDAEGHLQAFLDSLQEEPVKLNYLSWFPSAGITWQLAEQHALALNYGRRINRPDYNVLNPFYNQLSQLSFEKGNPRLRPEIVNNVELGYTFAYRYNVKLGYSLTEDQITRLIGPDDSDPRASFINWDKPLHADRLEPQHQRPRAGQQVVECLHQRRPYPHRQPSRLRRWGRGGFASRFLQHLHAAYFRPPGSHQI